MDKKFDKLEFNAGDGVYFPKFGGDVYYLSETQSALYPLKLSPEFDFTRDGRYSKQDRTPSIFHANEDNQYLLSALYGIDFEDPPLKYSALTKALLKKGKKVLCVVSNKEEVVSQGLNTLVNPIVVIDRFQINGEFQSLSGGSYTYATPLSEILDKETLKNLKGIIDAKIN